MSVYNGKMLQILLCDDIANYKLSKKLKTLMSLVYPPHHVPFLRINDNQFTLCTQNYGEHILWDLGMVYWHDVWL